MILSYKIDPFGSSEKRRRVRAKLTVEHSTSHYGQPAIVMPDGEALDLISWVECACRVEKASPRELASLKKILSSPALGNLKI